MQYTVIKSAPSGALWASADIDTNSIIAGTILLIASLPSEFGCIVPAVAAGDNAPNGPCTHERQAREADIASTKVKAGDLAKQLAYASIIRAMNLANTEPGSKGCPAWAAQLDPHHYQVITDEAGNPTGRVGYIEDYSHDAPPPAAALAWADEYGWAKLELESPRQILDKLGGDPDRLVEVPT